MITVRSNASLSVSKSIYDEESSVMEGRNSMK